MREGGATGTRRDDPLSRPANSTAIGSMFTGDKAVRTSVNRCDPHALGRRWDPHTHRIMPDSLDKQFNQKQVLVSQVFFIC